MDQQQPLVCPSHSTQYLVAVIVGILVGVGASFVYFKQAPATVSGENTYQAGYDAAKKRVLESALGGMIDTSTDIRTVQGPITEINGGRVTVSTQSLNPFEDPLLDSRVIIITPETKIYRLSSKDATVFQAETEAFIKKTKGVNIASQGIEPPDIFIRIPATVSDIAIGDNINVLALKNIKTEKEFSAEEIQIQPKPITITN